jgi:hypothetical protein
MKTSVRLSEIVEALEHPEEWESLLDRNTLTIITITDEEQPYLDEDAEDEALDPGGGWLAESVAELRCLLATADPLPLPSKFDVHEREIMRGFSAAQPSPARQVLLDAIHGPGAFRNFRRAADELGLREAWFTWRDDALKTIAREWLVEHGIPFTED